jgi:hypothetical protein
MLAGLEIAFCLAAVGVVAEVCAPVIKPVRVVDAGRFTG